jgi:hypothetical protein
MELVSSLEQFDSCEELDAWAQDELAPRVGPYGFDEPQPDDVVIMEDGTLSEELDAEVAEEAPTSDGAEAPADEGAATAPDSGEDMTAEAEAPAADVAEPAPQADSDRSADAEGGNAGAEAGGEAAGAADADAPEVDDAPAADAGDDGNPEYSETNVQVAGVDEPDIIKTDGSRILAVAEGKLHLASADGAEVLDTVDLPDDLFSGEMMLSGDRVVLFGTGEYEVFGGTAPQLPDESTGSSGDMPVDSDMAWPEGSPGTSVAEVDIVGDELELGDTFALEGNYISARMIDGVVRLVLSTDGHDRIPFVQPGGHSDQAEAQAAEVNQMLIENAEPEDFLPRWAELDENGESVDDGTLLGCEQAHAPEDFAGFGMVSVATIDVSDGVAEGISSSGGAGVMADGDTVYASQENLYVAAPEWIDWDDLSEDEADEAATDYGTNIHRFDISDPADAVYDVSGRVDGWLLNQFALDEHDGRLRVATTTGSPWGWDEDLSESHVSVLEPDDGALAEVGSVSGLGEGETIHSVRFMGDTGYVVTYQETDPLYTIDLSDPTAPQTKGELKILGYSAYLHPVGDGWLLGVGQDATEDGVVQGTQVSLFDVRDLDNPERVAQETLPNADSAAEWDHRAFLWWADTQLAAIPVSTYDWESDDSFEGLVGFTVDTEAEEITELGRISHPEQLDDGGSEPIPLPRPIPEPGSGGRVDAVEPDISVDPACIAPEPGEPADPCDDVIDNPVRWTPQVIRSWIIGDQVWTLSNAGLASTDLATFEDTNFIEFPG